MLCSWKIGLEAAGPPARRKQGMRMKNKYISCRKNPPSKKIEKIVIKFLKGSLADALVIKA
jgi:hypothetical protein